MSQRYWDPSYRLLKTIRTYQGASALPAPIAKVVKSVAVLRHHFWSAVSGANIPLNSKLGKGFKIPHPNGVVVHPNAHIGDCCTMMQQSTIGVKSATDDRVPHLGFGVEVGAGAKILGGVKIGAFAVIGANAVVTRDVPAYAIVVGAPARIIGSTLRNHDDKPITQRIASA